MRVTVDRTGRVVIPKAIRDQAGISEGGEVDVEFRDGRIEIEPARRGMRVVKRGRSVTIEAQDDMPTLTAAAVRSVLEHVRR
jgi:AbrB family looped-hinge helix DNA binding protein